MRFPGSDRWQELQDWLVWRGITWKDILGVTAVLGFLVLVTGVFLYAAIKAAI